MRWSWKICEAAGIGVYIHWTFLLLVGWLLVPRAGQTIGQTLAFLALVLAMFGCIALHEFGHALTARRFGIPTLDITLLPIGGVARLQRMPEDPVQEFLIAIAGPLVNVAIGVLLIAVLIVIGGASMMLRIPDQIAQLGISGSNFLFLVMLGNFGIVLFNMLPAFPMDGGRILRAVLAMLLDYGTATRVAAFIGQVLAVCIGVFGLLRQEYMLPLLALFVFMGARGEAAMVRTRLALRGMPVRNAMLTRFRSLAPNDTLEAATSELLSGAQHDFPVIDRGQIVGALYRRDLLEALSGTDRQRLVRDVMKPVCRPAHEGDMLETIFHWMNESGCSMVPVVRDNQLIGILTLENVGELLMVQSARGKTKATAPGPVAGEIERDFL